MKFNFLFLSFCLCVVASFFGAHHFLADILTCFYLQYAIIAVLFAFVYLWQRKFAYAVISIIIMLISGYNVDRAYSGTMEPIETPGPVIKIAQLNVLYNNKDLNELRDWVHQEKPDVLVLQEVTPRIVDELKSLADLYPYGVVSPQDDAFGSMVISRLEMTGARKTLLGTYVNYTDATIQLPGKKLKLYELHTIPPVGTEKANDRNEQLREIAKVIAKDKSDNKVLVGDLNITPYSPFYKKLEDESGLKNSTQHAFSYVLDQVTWPSIFPSFFRIQIDHLLKTPNIITESKGVGPDLGSDHLPVITVLKVE